MMIYTFDIFKQQAILLSLVQEKLDLLMIAWIDLFFRQQKRQLKTKMYQQCKQIPQSLIANTNCTMIQQTPDHQIFKMLIAFQIKRITKSTRSLIYRLFNSLRQVYQYDCTANFEKQTQIMEDPVKIIYKKCLFYQKQTNIEKEKIDFFQINSRIHQLIEEYVNEFSIKDNYFAIEEAFKIAVSNILIKMKNHEKDKSEMPTQANEGVKLIKYQPKAIIKY